jgi:DNA-binding NarL/FixJ family response regulator
VLEGVRSRDAGEVTVLGEDPARAGRDWRARLGVVSQGEPVGQALTVRETLDHFAAYTATPRSTGDLLDAVGLTGQAGTRVGRLSGGQRRRLAVALGVQGRPDLVFLDEPTTGRIAAAHPGVRVLVLTTYDTDADIVRAVEAGATGYLLKDTPLPQLADAIRAAARGETVLAPPVAAKLVSRMRAPAVEAPTARELQVLAGVAKGLTNADIGRELFIGEATVKTHLVRVFAKLGVDDRTRAVLVAVERGLLAGPGAAG